MTGQRKPGDGVANLSSVVTQGSAALVIQALQDVGNRGWFNVVERVGMDLSLIHISEPTRPY